MIALPMKTDFISQPRVFYASLVILSVAIYLFSSSQPWTLYFFRESLNPESGGEVLPLEVQEISSLLKKIKGLKNTDISQFGLSSDLAGNELIVQRAVEYLYPRRFVSSNRIIFTVSPEKYANNCQPLARANRVFLYECPN